MVTDELLDCFSCPPHLGLNSCFRGGHLVGCKITNSNNINSDFFCRYRKSMPRPHAMPTTLSGGANVSWRPIYMSLPAFGHRRSSMCSMLGGAQYHRSKRTRITYHQLPIRIPNTDRGADVNRNDLSSTFYRLCLTMQSHQRPHP